MVTQHLIAGTAHDASQVEAARLVHNRTFAVDLWLEELLCSSSTTEYLTGLLYHCVSVMLAQAEDRKQLCVKNKFYGQAERAISNSKLNVLLRLHICPIKLVVFQCSSYFRWEISS